MDEQLPNNVWYLPHFPVVRMDKTTTKVRIVFDCAAKCNGISLNDMIYAGPKLQQDLFNVLVRFRRNPVGIACDIKEMYLQIEIEEQDRSHFRLLWRDLDPSREPDVFEFSRVVFGKNSAPMESQFVAQENARRNQDRYPLAAETVLKSTYMDDSIDSVENDEEGVELYGQMKALWGIANMHARKWISNSPRVVEAIPREERATEIVRLAQREAFRDEYAALSLGKPIPQKSQLIKLNPRIDEDGVIRCDGRLKFAEFLPYDTRCPIILPRGHRVTRLIVKNYHERASHVAGINFILCQLSERFWIIAAREEIREWDHECNECKKRRNKPACQIMAPLPKTRLRFTFRPFAQTAVDFAGPLYTVQGRRKPRQKRWLCLFTCLETRAVHLEMAWGLDTDTFLNAFTRFTSRRGVPKEVISDRGTNFVGAVGELKKLVSQLDRQKLENKTAVFGVTWRFNPPGAPHFGGAHEVMVKAAKKATYAVVRDRDVNDEELITVFAGVESLLNSRPLTYQSSDPRDSVPLTPNHFLHGQMGGQFAPEFVETTTFHPPQRWRKVQDIISQVWRRWLKECIPALNSRPKWTSENRDLKVDDVVLVIQPDSPRGRWPLGRVIEVYPGRDGHTRVKVQGSRFKVHLFHTIYIKLT